MNCRPEAMLATAEELNYPFFICDESLLKWSFLSSSLVQLLNMSAKDAEENPRFWMDLVDWPSDVLSEKTASLSLNSRNVHLTLPFRTGKDDSELITIRFSHPMSDQSGDIFRLCSAKVNSEESRYKHEALKARDHEIEISARIQKILLTGAVSHDLKGLDVAAETIPSKEVDGDFYEFLALAPGITDFIIGDVMGKGVPAALLAAAVKTSYYKSLIYQELSSGETSRIGNVLGMIDSLITRNLMDLKKFLTLYYCRLDTNDSLLSFIDAGHTSFIYYDSSDGSCWSLKGANMPLGFVADQDYRVFQLPFNRGDLFFFYSDGISEVRDSEGEMFGHERIRQLVKAHGYLEPDQLLKKVLHLMFFYAAGTFDDDVTAVAVKITQEREAPLFRKEIVLSRNGSQDLESIREEFTADLSHCYTTGTEEDRTRLIIALMEAFANGISYTSGDLSLEWRLYARRAEVSIRFEGPDYDWLRQSPPSPEDYSMSGYGSFLIHRGTDSSLLLKGRGDDKKLIMIKEFP